MSQRWESLLVNCVAAITSKGLVVTSLLCGYSSRHAHKSSDLRMPIVTQMMRLSTQTQPTYDHTWDEIEEMLNQEAIHERNSWIARFEKARDRNDRQVMKDAARNCKALEGVIKTLKWTIGVPGIEDPLS